MNIYERGNGGGGGVGVWFFVVVLCLFGLVFFPKEIFLFLGKKKKKSNCCFPLKYKSCVVYIVEVQC